LVNLFFDLKSLITTECDLKLFLESLQDLFYVKIKPYLNKLKINFTAHLLFAPFLYFKMGFLRN